MKSVDVPKISAEIEAFVKARDWDQFHSLKNLAMALSVESSELLELFQWMKEEDAALALARDEFRTKLEDEVADVFVYLLRVVQKADIDLEKAVLKKLTKNAQKYPVELARGNAKKYDQF